MLDNNAPMVISPTAQKLSALRERAGYEVREFARKLGKKNASGYHYYERKFKGEAIPKRIIDQIRPHLVGRGDPPITDAELDDLAGFVTPVIESAGMQKSTEPPRKRVILYLTSPGGGDRLGAFVLVNEEVGSVPRPDNIDEVIEKAFGFKLLDNRNAPRFKRHETVIIDPTFEGVEGDDCVFLSEFDGQPRTMAVVGNLVRATPTMWIITQYSAPKKELEVPRAEYQRCWPIRGHVI